MKRLRWPRRSIGVIITEIRILILAVSVFVLAWLYHRNSLDIAIVGGYVGVLATIVVFATATGKSIGTIFVPVPDPPADEAAMSTVVLPRWSVMVFMSVLGLMIAGLIVFTVVLFASDTEATMTFAFPEAAGPNTPNIPLPPGFTTKCIYDADEASKQAHDIKPGGGMEQEFIATEPYIASLNVNIGINAERLSEGRVPPGNDSVRMDLLDDNMKVIVHNDDITIINNGRTTFQFRPVKVRSDGRYWLRLVNKAGIIISPYMLPTRGPNDRPPGAKRTRVYREVNRDDVERHDAVLVGCVGGARRTSSARGRTP